MKVSPPPAVALCDVKKRVKKKYRVHIRINNFLFFFVCLVKTDDGRGGTSFDGFATAD